MALTLNQTKTYSYTGGEQTESLAIGEYILECYGAKGGSTSDSGTANPGYAKGTLTLKSAQTMNIYVGQGGLTVNRTTSHNGAYNGGGGNTASSNSTSAVVGLGGGATDMRITGTTLNHRIIVAGGSGGGGNAGDATFATKPGAGGGASGGAGGDYSNRTGGKGGTATAGGAGGVYESQNKGGAGTFGKGGTANCIYNNSYTGGSGGGGWYGGGGTGGGGPAGGGGSGYVLTSSSSKPSGYAVGSDYYLTATTLTQGVSSSTTHGSAKITCVSLQPTISVSSKTNTSITVTGNYNSVNSSSTKTVKYKLGANGTWTTLNTTTSSSTSNFTVTASISNNFEGTVYFEISNGAFARTITYVYDNKPPVITFPSATYSTQHYEGETVTLFNGSDTHDKDLDYDYKVYVDGGLYTSQTNLKGNTFKLPYFDTMPESYQFKVEVRAKQSADTTNGTTQDIWSEWYTSPTITIKSPVLFIPNFTSIRWYQDIEQQGIISPFTEFETKHYCNGELYKTIQHPIGLTPPLLYTPIKPYLWSYEYYAVTRAKVEGQWSGWYKSPTVEPQFNVQPNDIEFNKALPSYLVQGEIATVEWGESLDPNSTKTTYTVSLMNNVTQELFEYVGVTENRLTFTTPRDIVSDKVTFSVVAYSDGLYSNPVSSPQLAITDVKVMDCTLDFPVLTTNVTGQFQNIILEINGDRRITKLENIVDYELPIHYFRSGLNTLKLIATDRNGVEVNRTWKVNLDFNLQDLEQVNKIDLKGFMSFNHNESEQYVPCTTLFKPSLDLGVVEHELYGSTTFEGVDSITQKLVITRDANDDISQLRTLKITGAIE